MKDSTRRRHRTAVDLVIAYIADHLDERLDLAHLAALAKMSPYHFQRVFLGLTGETPKQHLRRLRLERSLFLLRQPGVSVTDVAFDSAFEAHASFTRAFHQHFGVSPRSFRREADGRRKERTEPFEVVMLQPTRLATIPFLGPYDDDSQAFAELEEWAQHQPLPGDENVLGIYWDDQTVTAPDKTRAEVALPIPEDLVLSGGVRERFVAPGAYALVHHAGSASVRDTYERVFRNWFPTSGWRPDTRPMLIEYHRNTDPLRASLFVSVRRAGR